KKNTPFFIGHPCISSVFHMYFNTIRYCFFTFVIGLLFYHYNVVRYATLINYFFDNKKLLQASSENIKWNTKEQTLAIQFFLEQFYSFPSRNLSRNHVLKFYDNQNHTF